MQRNQDDLCTIAAMWRRFVAAAQADPECRSFACVLWRERSTEERLWRMTHELNRVPSRPAGFRFQSQFEVVQLPNLREAVAERLFCPAPPSPTKAPPGSAEKVCELRRRIIGGFDLFARADAKAMTTGAARYQGNYQQRRKK